MFSGKQNNLNAANYSQLLKLIFLALLYFHFSGLKVKLLSVSWGFLFSKVVNTINVKKGIFFFFLSFYC